MDDGPAGSRYKQPNKLIIKIIILVIQVVENLPYFHCLYDNVLEVLSWY